MNPDSPDEPTRTGGTPVPQAPAATPAPHDPAATDHPELRITRRYLPHWSREGSMYFVTFRLADSIPADKLRLWREQRLEWDRTHPRALAPLEEEEFNRLFPERLQKWLDAGYGDCILRDPEISGIVESALLHFDGERYDLDAYVVMPNHVHLLVIPFPGRTLSDLLHSWKSFTSKRINERLGRTGAIWLEESYDHIVREGELGRIREYIEANPSAAGLRPGEFRLRGTGVPPVHPESGGRTLRNRSGPS